MGHIFCQKTVSNLNRTLAYQPCAIDSVNVDGTLPNIEKLPYTAYRKNQGEKQMHHKKKERRYAQLAILAGALALSGCASSIWNAGDLAQWVRDQAVLEGCQRETIVLEEWYTQTDEGNVWRGTCKGSDGTEQSFGINVDSVWKPSQ